MEPINTNLSVRNPQSETAMQTSQPTRSIEGLLNLSENNPAHLRYISRVLRMVKRSINVANQSALTEDQYGDRAKDWANELILIVPYDQLWQSFDQAFLDRTNNYPISALDVKISWDKLKKKAASRRVGNVDPIANCPKRFAHVNDDSVHDDGVIEVVLGGLTPNPRTVIIPCDECRTDQNRIRFAEEKAKYARDFPAVEAFSAYSEYLIPKAFPDLKGKLRAVPETDIEILDRAIHQIQNEPLDKRFKKFDIYAAVRSLYRAKE
jgi:hypothetical protein